MERNIDPTLLSQVNDLEFIARSVADGFLQGVHTSYHRGVGIEFSQYRAYERGDAPASIDWKLYARSDRYFVREAERESELSVWFVLDGSRSMLQRSDGSDASSWSKFDYACHLLATLAYIAQGQGDRVGLLCVTGNGPTLLPALPGQRQWHRMLSTLSQIKVSGVFPPAARLSPELNRLRGPGLVVVLSDFYQSHSYQSAADDGSDNIEAMLSQLATGPGDAQALQLKCRDELAFNYQGLIRFEDLETQRQVLVSGAQAKTVFEQNHASQQQQLAEQLALLGVALDTFNIDRPLDGAIRAFLKRRQASMGR